ncbi:hypothetical protein EGX35_00710 [Clavibacter nebraskensis]|uniref:Metallopeptidase n=3 Tax=Clavibacter nebraskensis TaxID=31963 RepID=A0AAI8ZFU3_9MICO|nr:hypothetical protein EGX37_00710 [Clavibacter nebraskensis]QGV71104.1 hypothetical protein EGX35_00710 [Clavibacter nebraskensis]RIJ18668.1 hypothetical protein DZF97_01435 [Clavibacter nebraskensis]CCE74120.1 putative metallopeptidase [Clavibacter nebraskensis NCPPB 2581]
MALVAGLTVAVPQFASAYSLGNCRWGGISDLRWANFSGTTGIYATAMSTGASRWNATGTGIGISQAINTTSVNFNVNSANFGNVTWSGRAPNFDTCNAGGYNQALPLQLNTYYLANYSATQRAMVAAHELGHNLGLRHVGGDTTACGSVALMNPGDTRRTACSVYGPKVDDINGINAKY